MADKVRYYNLIAGVNGAGKTSLYSILKEDGNLGARINIDELVGRMGSWKDTLLQIRAGRMALELLNRCIDRRITFHQETTLPGATIVKAMERAKSCGYRIRLFFVGLESADVAVERVKRRVSLGGHGIDERTIRKRFEKMPENLRQILPLCDSAVFFDNTYRFRQVAVMQDGRLVDCDAAPPEWFRQILARLPEEEERQDG